MPKRTRSYEEALLESLRDPGEAAAYLNAHLEDSGDDADEVFLVALRDVAKAYGFGEVAQQTELGRESLYKALSENGNPRLTTLSALLKVMGLRLAVEVRETAAH